MASTSKRWLSRRWLRVDPLVLLLALLPALGWAVGFGQSLSQRRTAISAARATYTAALTATRAQLAGLVNRVAGDTALLQNLNWKLAHSVKSTLEGKLEAGGMDQLSLVNKNCADLGRVSLDKTVALTCPFAADAAVPADGFFWMSADGKPVLGLSRRITASDNNETVAIGLVRLDDNWLSLHPELRHTLKALDLRIGGPHGITLLREGTDASGAQIASLVSDNLLDRFVLANMGRNLAYGTPLLWPLLFAAGVCVLLALWRRNALRHRRKLAHAELLAWCKALTPGADYEVTATGEPETDFAAAKQLMTQALDQKSEIVHGLTQKRQSLEVTLKAQLDDVQRLRQRLAELAELDSLAVQLQRTTASFLTRIQTFHDQAEDLADILRDGLAKQGERLHQLLGSWQEGVQERSARKFLRGLSETPGSAEGKSRLDDQLAELTSLATGISDVGVNARVVTERLVEGATFATRLAGLWHGLALKTHEAEACTTLKTPLADVQALLQLEAQFANVSFSSPDLEAQVPPLPRPVWTSALYHAYLSLAELAQGVKVTLVGRLRQDGDKVIFIIQATTENGVTLPKRGERQAYHLEISRAIIAPFNLTLAVLPALNGPYPIAFTWTAPGKEKGASHREAPNRSLRIGGSAQSPEL